MTYGHFQEEMMRRVLKASGEFEVRYSTELDVVYKLDAVALSTRNLRLPPVGIQFTTRRSPQKRQKAMDVVRRTQVVERFLYLHALAPINLEASAILCSLVTLVATLDSSRGIVTAGLATDHQGSFHLTNLRSFPMAKHLESFACERAA